MAEIVRLPVKSFGGVPQGSLFGLFGPIQYHRAVSRKVGGVQPHFLSQDGHRVKYRMQV